MKIKYETKIHSDIEKRSVGKYTLETSIYVSKVLLDDGSIEKIYVAGVKVKDCFVQVISDRSLTKLKEDVEKFFADITEESLEFAIEAYAIASLYAQGKKYNIASSSFLGNVSLDFGGQGFYIKGGSWRFAKNESIDIEESILNIRKLVEYKEKLNREFGLYIEQYDQKSGFFLDFNEVLHPIERADKFCISEL